MSDEKQNWPMRRIEDPQPLRAMAHPLRIRLSELLAAHGPATATELAQRVGHSPANCSWHLRQLAAGGFIEEAEGGTGRQRIWKLIPGGNSYRDNYEDPEMSEAAAVAGSIQLQHEVGEFREWRATRHADSREWVESAFSNQSLLWLTPEELDELGKQVMDLYTRGIERHIKPETRPEGARPIRLVAWGFPDKNLE
ncbi:MAG: winged helix-turn-helix domain-containing protein [Stackebrandtia sp.]